MVFCATVLIADILYSVEFSVVVKDVQMCVYNIDTVYAYHLLFFSAAHVRSCCSLHVQFHLVLTWTVDMNIGIAWLIFLTV